MSMNSKIVDDQHLQARSAALRAAGKRLVATNGCFDLLHAGHVRYLQAARALGDALVVGINGNDSARELKGRGRPVNNENDRAEVIAALGCVDLVTIFHELRATHFLELAQPAIYVKGGDYEIGTLDESEKKVLEYIGTEIRIIPCEKGYSTTALLKKMGTVK
jgi:rfaE bifunctional protein nucleotidyltransferase chain/domain